MSATTTPIRDLHIRLGDSWSPEGISLASPYVGSDSIFDDFAVHRFEGGYYVEAGIHVGDFLAGVDVAFGRDTEAEGYTEDASVAWLNEHADRVEAFFRERYGAELDGSWDEWTAQRLAFTLSVGPDETPQGIYQRFYEETRAVMLYNELDRGTFGCEWTFRLLRDYIEKGGSAS